MVKKLNLIKIYLKTKNLVQEKEIKFLIILFVETVTSYLKKAARLKFFVPLSVGYLNTENLKKMDV